MPHSTTKTVRHNRPDSRPNAKLRRKLFVKEEKAKTIQDIRVTKVQRNEKKERLAQVTPLSTLSKDEKKLRAIKKKLKAIDDLVEQREAGIELDAQQLIKLSCLDDLLREMDELVNKSNKKNKKTAAKHDSDDNSDDDDDNDE